MGGENFSRGGFAPPAAPGYGPDLRSFRSKFSVLKKVLVTLLGLFGAPAVIWLSGNCAPLAPLAVSNLCKMAPMAKFKCTPFLLT